MSELDRHRRRTAVVVTHKTSRVRTAAVRAVASINLEAIAQGIVADAVPAPAPPTAYTLTYDQLRMLDAIVARWNRERAKTREHCPSVISMIKDATHAEVIDLILQWELERE